MTSICIPATPTENRVLPQHFAVGRSSQRVRKDFLANSEPTLEDVLADDVVCRLMARDGVVAKDLLTLIDKVRPYLT